MRMGAVPALCFPWANQLIYTCPRSKAEELKNIMGVADPMVTFKARIREINDFHMKYPGSVPERSEAQDLLAGYKKADKRTFL
jgi:hypothetical protein